MFVRRMKKEKKIRKFFRKIQRAFFFFSRFGSVDPTEKYSDSVQVYKHVFFYIFLFEEVNI